MAREKIKFALRIAPETQQLVKELCERDNCQSQNEFIEKAIRFYAGYVSGKEATAYLPPALVAAMRGTVQDSENRIARLLFKLAVEVNMMMNVLAAGMEISDEDLKTLRARSVREVKQTNGRITGALAAAALDADVYENWTDVSGILMADPRIVDDPAPIRHLTYGELRELSYIGAQVLHEGTIFPVREKNIPLNIRNTNDPEHPGTTILESIEEDTNDGSFITGIAGKKGFSVITIAKTGMSGDPGTLVRILEILAKHEVNVEYIPSGIDIISLVVESKKVSKCLYAMLGELQKEVQPNKITVTEHIAVVAAVGRKMAYRPGVSGKIFAKLGENGVNIRMITQGPEELNIIVGVEEKDFAQAIRVLYDSFVKEHI